eukprot:38451-Chlamydomonas_euryale.AAC.1
MIGQQRGQFFRVRRPSVTSCDSSAFSSFSRAANSASRAASWASRAFCARARGHECLRRNGDTCVHARVHGSSSCAADRASRARFACAGAGMHAFMRGQTALCADAPRVQTGLCAHACTRLNSRPMYSHICMLARTLNLPLVNSYGNGLTCTLQLRLILGVRLRAFNPPA